MTLWFGGCWPCQQLDSKKIGTDCQFVNQYFLGRIVDGQRSTPRPVISETEDCDRARLTKLWTLHYGAQKVLGEEHDGPLHAW
jgi:hypothetical protein